MNILDYRAMKAREAEESQKQAEDTQPEVDNQKDEPVVENDAEQNNTQQQDTQKKEPTESTNNDAPPTTDKVFVEGIGEVSLDDIKEWNRGYLRNQDYTRKTQEVSRLRKEIEKDMALLQAVKTNPQLAGQVGQSEPDPVQNKVAELESRLYNLMVEKEIADLQVKYKDFDVREALEIASNTGVNLEDAYLLAKAKKSVREGSKPQKEEPQIDIEALKRELREELKRELEEESTGTIIGSSEPATPVKDTSVKLTPDEMAYVRKRGLDPEVYYKWKNASR